jgi:hypothetical protein
VGNAYTAGDPITFAIQTLSAAGTLANTTTVSLVVTKPDGTSTGTLTPTNSATGVYEYTYTTDTTLSGRYSAKWTASGTIAGGEPQSFWVMPANPILTVTEAKDHLGIIGNDDDAEVAAYILSCIPIVEGLALHPITVESRTYTTDGGRAAIVLPHFATSITSVTERGSALAAGAYDYDSSTAILYRKFGDYTYGKFWPGVRSVTVTYSVGSAYPAANVQMAVKETVKYLWRQTKTGPDSFQDGYISQAAISGVSAALKERIRNILASESNDSVPL